MSDYDEFEREIAGEDRESLLRISQSITDTVQRLGGAFQVIVVERADLDGAVFRDAVNEHWRGGRQALIPPDWIEEG